MWRWLKSGSTNSLALIREILSRRSAPIDRSSEIPNEAEVLDALGRIDRSTEVGGSPNIKRFLDFVVKQTLAGNGPDLKESVIGVEVFAKETTWDSRKASVVRTNAARVRTKLQKYYNAEGLEDPVLIELDRGNYVPKFRFRANQEPPQVSLRTYAQFLPVAGATGLLGILAVLVYAGNVFTPDPRVTSYLPLTTDGLPRGGPVLTDGQKIYFEEQIQDKWFPVALPLSGGTASPVKIPLDSPRLFGTRQN